MAFSDLLTSSRGPGIIGTLIALLVLGGFGGLFFLVFDDSMQGKDVSTESQIRQNNESIASAQRQIASLNTDLNQLPQREEDNQTANKLIASKTLMVKQIADLQAERDEATTAVGAAEKALEDYKNSYRKAERASAAGETIPELKLLTGVTYKSVKISVVDAVGMQFRYEGGVTRADYKDLPESLQDRFQFDEVQKAKTIDNETAQIEIAKKQSALQNLQDRLIFKERDLAATKAQVETDNKAVKDLRTSTANQKSALNSFRSRIKEEESKPVSKAPAMRIELARLESSYNAALASIPVKEQAIRTNEAKVSPLMLEIEQIKKDIKAEIAKATPAPQ